MSDYWEQRQAPSDWWTGPSSFIQEILIALAVGAVLLASAVYVDRNNIERQEQFEQTLFSRQEVLENTRFVREAAMRDSRLKPFQRLNLKGAQLGGLRLSCESRGKLDCANMWRSDLTDANLSGSVLVGADLRWADLTSTDLRKTNVRNADLTNADLRNTDLTETDLSVAKMRRACFDDLTQWGANRKPKKNCTWWEYQD